MPLARERFRLCNDEDVYAELNIQQSDHCLIFHFHTEQTDKINDVDVVFGICR